MTFSSFHPGDRYQGYRFTDRNFSNGKFVTEVKFINCVFDDVELIEITFNRCEFQNCSFKKTGFTTTDLYDCTLKECILDEGLWYQCTHKDNHFTECSFKSMELMVDVVIESSMLNKCMFSDTENGCDSIVFKDCEFLGTSFNKYELKGMVFESSRFTNALFSLCQFYKSDMSNCQLRLTKFKDNVFRKSIIENTSLSFSIIDDCCFHKNMKIKKVSLFNTTIKRGKLPPEVTTGITIEPLPIKDTNTNKTDKNTARTNANCYQESMLSRYHPIIKKDIPKTGRNRAYRFMTQGL